MSVTFSAALKSYSKKILVIGGGELAKQLIIEASNYSLETHTISRYLNSPASQVSLFNYVIDMRNYHKLYELIVKIKPDYIVPEIECLNIQCLLDLEKEGYNIIPSCRAIFIAMNRERLRMLATNLGFLTSTFLFATSYSEFESCVSEIGLPCVIKPTMSSSGKGQVIIKNKNEIKDAWNKAHSECRGKCEKIIIEQFIPFEQEITLMTYRYKNRNDEFNIGFCNPIGHIQKK